MITAYSNKNGLVPEIVTKENAPLLGTAVWIDLLYPTKEEEQLVEDFLKLALPTREEMQEIEISNRLYRAKNTIFMTVTMLAKADSAMPLTDAITLVLKENTLITIRYVEPQALSSFIFSLPKLAPENPQATHLIIELIEAAIERLADITEGVGRYFDNYSQTIFRSQASDHKLDYKHLLQGLGSSGDLNTKAWESLASFNRLNGFFTQALGSKLDEDLQSRLMALTKDIAALSEQVKFLTAKVNFLLDATLGMVNIEQNNIIKIFSIAAVIFLPPTLIASIYGMNFGFIPELSWSFGYPLSIGLMIFSGWLPYKYFKIKKWL